MKPDMDIPHMISAYSLSQAWVQALASVAARREVSPQVVTFPIPRDGVPEESSEIRSALDDTLARLEMQSCHTVANTIFPAALWHPMYPANRLFSTYISILPVLRKPRKNRKGLYFERMIDFGNDSGPGTGKNQLNQIINTWNKGNTRRSALQAAIFDPKLDHTNSPYLGFPCLHQVSFVPSEGKFLSVIGYYGRQYVLERAYGNYLGLARLGRFMAHELGLQLIRATCVAGAATMGQGARRSDIRELLKFIDVDKVLS